MPSHVFSKHFLIAVILTCRVHRNHPEGCYNTVLDPIPKVSDSVGLGLEQEFASLRRWDVAGRGAYF